MKRHKFRPNASDWNAMTTLATVYQSSEKVKIVLRPNRSATKPNNAVPTNNPAKSAATKLATPLVPNSPGVVGVNIPLRTRPGAI